jgi:hypothetical protein
MNENRLDSMFGNEEVQVMEPRTEMPAVAKLQPCKSALRGLLFAEWLAHSRLVLVFLGLWLAAVWVLPLFANPGWILTLGVIYALLAGPVYGGADVLESCEEFSFSLPATRFERYFARIIIGAGTFLALTAINLLALGLDLSHVLARLYIDTGIIKPTPVLKPGLLYGLVAALPFAVFSFSFTIAAITHSRLLILTAWFWASLAALLVLQLGFWYEDLAWESLTGAFSFPLLIVAGTAVLWAGLRAYQRKEIGPSSTPLTLPGRWWLWIILFVAGLCVALILISSLIKHYPKLLATA